MKRWLLGTHQGGVARQHLDYYLDEFAFRFNRRTSRRRGLLFHRLMELAVRTPPKDYETIVWSRRPEMRAGSSGASRTVSGSEMRRLAGRNPTEPTGFSTAANGGSQSAFGWASRWVMRAMFWCGQDQSVSDKAGDRAAFRAWWSEVMLALGPAGRADAERAVAELYLRSFRSPPPVQWQRSPLEMVRAASESGSPDVADALLWEPLHTAIHHRWERVGWDWVGSKDTGCAPELAGAWERCWLGVRRQMGFRESSVGRAGDLPKPLWRAVEGSVWHRAHDSAGTLLVGENMSQAQLLPPLAAAI